MDEEVANCPVRALTQEVLQQQEAALQHEAEQNLAAPRNTDLQSTADLQGQLLAAQRFRATFVDVNGHRTASISFFFL